MAKAAPFMFKAILKKILFSRIASPFRMVRREFIHLKNHFDDAGRKFYWDQVVFSPWMGIRPRMFCLRKRRGFRVSPQAVVRHHARIGLSARLVIEENVYINEGLSVYSGGGLIHIAAGATLACKVNLITRSHQVGPPSQRSGPSVEGDIFIGEGSWVGFGVTILSGAKIGPGCILAAGSVVAENSILEPNSLYAGVPAKKKRDLELTDRPKSAD